MAPEGFQDQLAKLKAAREAKRGPNPPQANPMTSSTHSVMATTSSRELVPNSSPTSSPGQPSKYYSTTGPAHQASRPPPPKMNMFGDSANPRLGGGVGRPPPFPPTGQAGHPTRPPGPAQTNSYTQSYQNGSSSSLEPPRKKQAYASSPYSSQPTSRPTSPSSQGSGYNSSAVGAGSLGDKLGKAAIGESSSGSNQRNGLIKSRMDDPDADETMDSIDDGDVAATPEGKAPLGRFARRADTSPPSQQSASHGSPAQMIFKISDTRSVHSDSLYATRMADLYASLTRERILEIMDEFPNDKLSAIAKRLSAASKGQDYRSVKSTSGLVASSSSSGSISANATPIQHKIALGTASPMAFSRLSSPAQPQQKCNPPIIKKQPKGSAIYANRKQEDRDRTTGNSSTIKGDFPNRGKKRKTGGEESGSDDGDGAYREGGRRKGGGSSVENIDDEQVLKVFNECEPEVLTGSIVCTQEQVESIISLRPFLNIEDLKKKLARKKGVSFSLFEQYQNVMQGYIEVDRCLSNCEEIGTVIEEIMDVWTGTSTKDKGKDTGAKKEEGDDVASEADATNTDTGLHISSVNEADLKAAIGQERNPKRRELLARYQFKQPKFLEKGVVLKDYQMVGLNWLSLLHKEDYSCILADEMGLGKTIQVISFFCLLKQQGNPGPHLVVVPSSTLENWVREFTKFAPQIKVQTYYGSQADRYQLRKDFVDLVEEGELEVLITTYDMAWKADDHKFLRKKISFDCAVFDEGHTLKNFESQRYQSLISIKPRWRLLLTGTPLQNNLQELVSLLNFILPDIFDEAEDHLRQIFKVHAKGTANLLSQQRVSRARTMMTPFVLRRRKAQVLKDLPARTDRVLSCPMTTSQRFLYDRSLRRSRTVLDELVKEDEAEEVPAPKRGRKGVLKPKDDGSANILMDLRKATNHPLLFRRFYTDAKIKVMARDCMNEPEFVDSVYDMIVEDMAVMTDAELYHFCLRYKSVNKHVMPIKHFLNVGKVQAVQRLLETCVADGRRMLLFSQFTQVLDILQVVLTHLGYRYIRLDGSTKVDERQNLVDDFTEDEEIKVFLLSTRAGGMGINLVAASVVCIYDQDFNPHNDRQAADRAYRIGQTREVEVIKLLSEDTIDEDIYRLGVTKLKLDDAVGGGNSGAAGDSLMENGTEDTPTANEIKKSLLTTVKAKADEIVAIKGESTGDGEENVVSDGE